MYTLQPNNPQFINNNKLLSQIVMSTTITPTNRYYNNLIEISHDSLIYLAYKRAYISTDSTNTRVNSRAFNLANRAKRRLQRDEHRAQRLITISAGASETRGAYIHTHYGYRCIAEAGRSLVVHVIARGCRYRVYARGDYMRGRRKPELRAER